MRQNFLNKFYGPGSDVAGAAASASPVGLALAGAQAGFGIVQSIASDNKIKKLLAQRKAYKTPEEYFQILQATQSMAQQGYDPVTLNYLTDQTDRAFSSGLSTATRLGANPNDLSALFDQKMQGIMKIGAENAQLNMANFSKYLSALDVIGQNKVAEFNSEQDLIKDKLQAASAEKAAGIQNIGSAANAAISLSSAAQTANLYGANPGTVTQGVGNSFNAPATQGILSGVPNAATLNAGTSPANSLGTIPYNPSFYGRIAGLSAYLNRGR